MEVEERLPSVELPVSVMFLEVQSAVLGLWWGWCENHYQGWCHSSRTAAAVSLSSSVIHSPSLTVSWEATSVSDESMLAVPGRGLGTVNAQTIFEHIILWYISRIPQCSHNLHPQREKCESWHWLNTIQVPHMELSMVLLLCTILFPTLQGRFAY